MVAYVSQQQLQQTFAVGHKLKEASAINVNLLSLALSTMFRILSILSSYLYAGYSQHLLCHTFRPVWAQSGILVLSTLLSLTLRQCLWWLLYLGCHTSACVAQFPLTWGIPFLPLLLTCLRTSFEKLSFDCNLHTKIGQNKPKFWSTSTHICLG